MSGRTGFQDRDVWVFDLDNTLYPASCNLFAQIDANMTRFIEDELSMPSGEARKLQKDLYVSHGTTLAGLMAEHSVSPHAFMAHVHDIDLTPVEPNSRLRAAMAALPGRRFVFTNGSLRHAENVARKIGVWDLFEGAFDVEGCGWTPKPHEAAYDAFLGAFGIEPERAVMFEDMADNLRVPHALGMTTVLIQTDAAWCEDEPAAKRPSRPGEAPMHVDHATSDLTGFLEGLTRAARTAGTEAAS
ncbi:pyrimidine 5'-nucleotidase [Parvularcula dongshanensis]|uniref:Putative hydrolase of the HAD superfamily n=1 Tax=Parvularcula dongshanensis TaxID=1173995 RepID=A0A840I173_9PROT|nr:pyrimidine 5'-nucleotidase [Parvularcula dongshanensis]MBB4657952.1 putative hydrolase of the HAD superfamily [Parvularcula dongshanensis]